jgi:hypothetical protein
MPSPKRTNKANAYIVPMRISERTALALDQRRDDDDTFASTRADLIEPSKPKKLGDQEVSGLLSQLEGRRGASDDEDDEQEQNGRRERLAHFLRGKGLSEDDIRTACDVSLGIGGSAKFGGALAGGMGGGLQDRIGEQPSSHDAGFCAEERMGIEPLKDRGRLAGRDRRVGRDDFGMLFGMLPTFERLEAQRPRRRTSDRQLGMDARAVDSFNSRFPNAARIKPAY